MDGWIEGLVERAIEKRARLGVQVAAVVTQPGRPKGRKKTPVPSPVEDLARERGLPDDLILTPASAKDEASSCVPMAMVARYYSVTAL
eukprot:scaffold595388_cov14-Prasinocladus_malaysianus.AAC.1